MPIFGYPLLQFSPKNEMMELTDRKVWNHAILSNGKSIKHPAEDEFKMVSTKHLQNELSQKVDRANLAKSQMLTRNGFSQEFPAGMKYNMYQEAHDEATKLQKNHWLTIYNMMRNGIQQEDSQNMLTESYQHFNKYKGLYEYVQEKFQRGESISAENIKEELASKKIRVKRLIKRRQNGFSMSSNMPRS